MDDRSGESRVFTLPFSEEARKHGYPLRAIVPGVYGMKHVKWLSKIELVDYVLKVTERRGDGPTKRSPQ